MSDLGARASLQALSEKATSELEGTAFCRTTSVMLLIAAGVGFALAHSLNSCMEIGEQSVVISEFPTLQRWTVT